MNFPVENLNIFEFLIGSTLNYSNILECFGNLTDWKILSQKAFDFNYDNHWVWLPNVAYVKIVTIFYNHLNQDQHFDFTKWKGWYQL